MYTKLIRVIKINEAGVAYASAERRVYSYEEAQDFCASVGLFQHILVYAADFLNGDVVEYEVRPGQAQHLC
jgi:hypothetical protein